MTCRFTWIIEILNAHGACGVKNHKHACLSALSIFYSSILNWKKKEKKERKRKQKKKTANLVACFFFFSFSFFIFSFFFIFFIFFVFEENSWTFSDFGPASRCYPWFFHSIPLHSTPFHFFSFLSSFLWFILF